MGNSQWAEVVREGFPEQVKISDSYHTSSGSEGLTQRSLHGTVSLSLSLSLMHTHTLLVLIEKVN